MEIRDMIYIVEISRTQNITRAAAKLYLSQPALSKALKKVEDSLGVLLFLREDNRMQPTEAGKYVIAQCEKILNIRAEMEKEIEAIKLKKKGKVVLGVPPAISAIDFPNIILHFRRSFPDIQLEIREFGARHLEDMVVDGALDVAISMRPVLSNDLNEIPIVQSQILCAVNNDHSLAEHSSIALEDLADFVVNTFPEDHAVHQHLVSQFLDHGLKPHIGITSPTCELLLQVSRLNGEACVLPGPCIGYYDNEGMVLLPFDPPMVWELCIVYKKNTSMSEATKAMISCIRYIIEPQRF